MKSEGRPEALHLRQELPRAAGQFQGFFFLHAPPATRAPAWVRAGQRHQPRTRYIRPRGPPRSKCDPRPSGTAHALSRSASSSRVAFRVGALNHGQPLPAHQRPNPRRRRLAARASNVIGIGPPRPGVGGLRGPNFNRPPPGPPDIDTRTCLLSPDVPSSTRSANRSLANKDTDGDGEGRRGRLLSTTYSALETSTTSKLAGCPKPGQDAVSETLSFHFPRTRPEPTTTGDGLTARRRVPPLDRLRNPNALCL